MSKAKSGDLSPRADRAAKAKNGQNTGRNTAGLRPPWPKGVSGNPGGRPKNDLAADISRAIFEGNFELIAKAMLKRLKKGDPKAFTALADRGYGKAPQSVTVTGDVSHDIRVEFVNVDGLIEA